MNAKSKPYINSTNPQNLHSNLNPLASDHKPWLLVLPSIIRLHKLISLNTFRKALNTGGMAPRLEFNLLSNRRRETARPFLSRESTHNGLDCGRVDEVRVDAHVVWNLRD